MQILLGLDSSSLVVPAFFSSRCKKGNCRAGVFSPAFWKKRGRSRSPFCTCCFSRACTSKESICHTVAHRGGTFGTPSGSGDQGGPFAQAHSALSNGKTVLPGTTTRRAHLCRDHLGVPRARPCLSSWWWRGGDRLAAAVYVGFFKVK